MSKDTTERNPVEVLAKAILQDPVRTTAQMHQILKQEFGMETPEERSPIIEEAVDMAKRNATKLMSSSPTGPTGETPKKTEEPAPEVVTPKATQQEPPRPATQVTVSSPHQQDAQARALGFINSSVWNSMGIMAKTFSEGGALPNSVKNASQLMMVLQAGYEAGMQPIAAINSFYFVNGKLAMYGDQMISQVIRAGHIVEFLNASNKACTCKITRGDNGQSMQETVAIEDIPQRIKSKGGPWQDYPKRMLKYKAFAEVAHFLVPEALGGVGIVEDVQLEQEKDGTAPAGTRPPKVEKKQQQATPRQHRPLTEVLDEGKAS